jgi:hypothetical protein
LTVGTASTANALNTSNAYTGTTFTASTQFSGPGTGLTGTASSLTAGTASTANALNTSNAYSGTTFTASTQFTGPGTGLTGTASSLTVGTASTANALNTSNAYTGTTFTATTEFSGPGTGLTGIASSLTANIANNINVNSSQSGFSYTVALLGAYTGTSTVIAGPIQYSTSSNILQINSSNAVTSPNGGSVAGTDGGWVPFTPNLTGSGSSVTFTYSANAQQGRYLVIGNMVYVQLYIGWTAVSATGDYIIMDNLPIAGSATPSGWGNIYNGFGLLQCSKAVSPTLQLFPNLQPNSRRIYFYSPNGSLPLQSSSTSTFNASTLISTTGYIYGSFSYSTS